MNNLAEVIARELKDMLPQTLRHQSQEGLAHFIEDVMKRELELSDPSLHTAFGVIAGGKRDGI